MTELQAMDWHFAEARANRKVMDSRAPKELREPEPTWFDLTETRRGGSLREWLVPLRWRG